MARYLIALALLLAVVSVGQAIVCLQNICDQVNCDLVSKESCAARNGVIKPGFCGCCDTCVIQLKEGESCAHTLILGIPPKSECGFGTYCDPQQRVCKYFGFPS